MTAMPKSKTWIGKAVPRFYQRLRCRRCWRRAGSDWAWGGGGGPHDFWACAWIVWNRGFWSQR